MMPSAAELARYFVFLVSLYASFHKTVLFARYKAWSKETYCMRTIGVSRRERGQ